MNKKKLFIIALSLGIPTLALIIYSTWYWLNLGTLKTVCEQRGIIYTIDGKGHEYSESKEFKNLSVGDHTIKAFGEKPETFKTRDYTINIKKGETTEVKIELDYDHKNIDYSGVEEDPYSK